MWKNGAKSGQEGGVSDFFFRVLKKIFLHSSRPIIGRRQKRGFFAASFEVVQCAAVEVEELSRGGRKKGEKVCVESVEKVFFPRKETSQGRKKIVSFYQKRKSFPGECCESGGRSVG